MHILSSSPVLNLKSNSWNKSSVSFYSSQLLANASVATAMAVEMLPEFGVNVSSVRSVGVDFLDLYCIHSFLRVTTESVIS